MPTLPCFDNSNPTNFNFHRSQIFSIPSVLVYYLSNNPKSPEGLEKLQKTCKYFFFKTKIIVVKENIFHKNDWFYCHVDPPRNSNTFDGHFLNKKDFILKNFGENGKIKFWPTSRLSFLFGVKQFPINVFENIYRWNLKILTCVNQNLTLNDIDFLMDSGTIVELKLINVNIFDAFGILITMDKILAKVPNIQIFTYQNKNEIFTTKTFQNLNSLKFHSKLTNSLIIIDKLDSNAEVSLLCKFVKNTYLNSERIAPLFTFLFGDNVAENAQHKLSLAFENLFEEWKESENGMKPEVKIGKSSRITMFL